MQDVTNISDFVYRLRFKDIPKDVIEKMKVSILYNLSVALASGNLAKPPIDHLYQLEDKKPQESKWLSAKAMSMDHVVFANACSITARGQNETMYDILAHTGCVIIPGALALGETNKISGQELLTALVAGYESTAAIAAVAATQTMKLGFRSTSLFSPFGAATTASKILKQDKSQIKTAVALTSNFNAGNTQTWVDGTDEWIFQIGMASQNGLVSALIAEDKTIVGSSHALKGPKGFYRTHVREYKYKPSDWLGTKWETLNIQYKPYPGCALNQVPMYAAMRIKNQYNIKSNEIEYITVNINPVEYEYPGLLERLPFASRSAAIMSLPFAVAICFLNNHITYGLFERYNDPSINQLMKKIEIVSDNNLEKQTVKYNIKLKNGRIIEYFFENYREALEFDWNRIVEFATSLSNEMDISNYQLKRLIRLIENIEAVDDVSELVSTIV